MTEEKVHTVDEKSIVVVGGGISGLTSAIEAAEAGQPTVIVEKNSYLGGRVAQNYQYFPKMCPPTCGLEINFQRIRKMPSIRYYTQAEVAGVSGVRPQSPGKGGRYSRRSGSWTRAAELARSSSSRSPRCEPSSWASSTKSAEPGLSPHLAL